MTKCQHPDSVWNPNNTRLECSHCGVEWSRTGRMTRVEVIISNEPGFRITEARRTKLGLVIPRPPEFGGRRLEGDSPDACHMCWGSGDGDGMEGRCTRCRGYSVEPSITDVDGLTRWTYGGDDETYCEAGPLYSTGDAPPRDSTWEDEMENGT